MKPCSFDYAEKRCERDLSEVQQFINNIFGEDRAIKEAYENYCRDRPETRKEFYN